MLFGIFTPFVTAQENRKRSFVSLYFPFSASSPLCTPPAHHPTSSLLSSPQPLPLTLMLPKLELWPSTQQMIPQPPPFWSSVSFPTISFVHHPPHSSTHPDFTKVRQTSLYVLALTPPPLLPPLNLARGTEEPVQAHSFSGLNFSGCYSPHCPQFREPIRSPPALPPMLTLPTRHGPVQPSLLYIPVPVGTTLSLDSCVCSGRVPCSTSQGCPT